MGRLRESPVEVSRPASDAPNVPQKLAMPEVDCPDYLKHSPTSRSKTHPSRLVKQEGRAGGVELRMEQLSGRGSVEPTEENQASDVWPVKF